MTEIEKRTDKPERAPEEAQPDDVATEIAETMVELAIFARKVSGPLPPPDVLEAYERMEPGTTNRLLTMLEKEQTHRHTVLETAVYSEAYLGRWGQRFGFAISVILGVGSLALVAAGRTWAGAAIVTVDLVALATVFVIGRRSSQQESTLVVQSDDDEQA